MLLTKYTRQMLEFRRFKRRMEGQGYELVNLDGGRLWELDRGARTRCRMTDAVVAPGGKCLFVKIEGEVGL